MSKLDDLIAKLEKKYTIVVGYPKGKQITYPPDDRKSRKLNTGGQTVLQVATINEYGKRHVWWPELNKGKGGYIDIPARPFIRNAYRKNRKEIVNLLRGFFSHKNFLDEKYLDKIGIKISQMVRQSITDGPWVPNSIRTIRIKKSSRPLIDRGIMRRSVNYEVRIS